MFYMLCFIIMFCYQLTQHILVTFFQSAFVSIIRILPSFLCLILLFFPPNFSLSLSLSISLYRFTSFYLALFFSILFSLLLSSSTFLMHCFALYRALSFSRYLMYIHYFFLFFAHCLLLSLYFLFDLLLLLHLTLKSSGYLLTFLLVNRYKS